MTTISASAIKPHTIIAVKSSLEELLANSKKYVANFYFSDPTDEITDSDNTLIIAAEYGAIAKVLVDAEKAHDNFSFGETNPDKFIFSKWTVISENNVGTSEEEN